MGEEVKKYEFVEEDQINYCGRVLKRVRALIDISAFVKAGDLGGYIESEKNLSHDNEAWVSDEARVYGKARVYGEAWVYGEARVSENYHVMNITNLKYNLTFTPQNVAGGCRLFTHEEFRDLTLDQCQTNWHLEELENYKAYQKLYLDRTSSVAESEEDVLI